MCQEGEPNFSCLGIILGNSALLLFCSLANFPFYLALVTVLSFLQKECITWNDT